MCVRYGPCLSTVNRPAEKQEQDVHVPGRPRSICEGYADRVTAGRNRTRLHQGWEKVVDGHMRFACTRIPPDPTHAAIDGGDPAGFDHGPDSADNNGKSRLSDQQ